MKAVDALNKVNRKLQEIEIILLDYRNNKEVSFGSEQSEEVLEIVQNKLTEIRNERVEIVNKFVKVVIES